MYTYLRVSVSHNSNRNRLRVTVLVEDLHFLPLHLSSRDRLEPSKMLKIQPLLSIGYIGREYSLAYIGQNIPGV